MDQQQRKYIDDVVEILRIGAEGNLTKREVEAEAKERGVQHSIHLFSHSPGPALFEYSSSEKDSDENERHPRLNVYALGIYLAQASIEQAKSHAIRATWFAGVSCLIAALSCVGNIITLVMTFCSV